MLLPPTPRLQLPVPSALREGFYGQLFATINSFAGAGFQTCAYCLNLDALDSLIT